MHAKSDSEVTSLAPSSPRRPLYYVQSPSRHDGSIESTPMASPHHSREPSAATTTARFSGILHHHRLPGAPWKSYHAIEDEDEEEREPLPFACYVILFILSFSLLFSLFSLILWGSSLPYSPDIKMQSVRFRSFNVHAGSDPSGVPTKILSINGTVKLSFRNPATFFGVHVTSTPIILHYDSLKIASGDMIKFYQSRKSQRLVQTVVQGDEIPLYGGGSNLSSSDQDNMKVKLNLSFVIRSRAYVLGKLVKPKFYKRIQCSVVLDKRKLEKPISLKNSCTYR
ncbi:hypothetical protein AMTRI_Chr11g152010 [Amborella trichopoda]|uniref:Uncharacterized protein n=1 Tax=Amborella trichopoda TaxID=13333 RepID=U5D3T4_AMBTC|nr:uncharacterized protein LOC18444355 [Amborella trichopoda]ERN16057.1 hypothetical protein AMTR_s00030p00122220 [Amborella trichopoda]|eukprot:XP_020529329.1 uncharacterized protein LOC18444355 [Amborella trichopoda]